MASLFGLMASIFGTVFCDNDDDGERARTRSTCPANVPRAQCVRKCFAKMKEAATKGMRDEDGNTDKKEMGTQGTSTDEKSQTRRDLSSGRLEVLLGDSGVLAQDAAELVARHRLLLAQDLHDLVHCLAVVRDLLQRHLVRLVRNLLHGPVDLLKEFL